MHASFFCFFNFVDAAGCKIAGCNITHLATDCYSRQITTLLILSICATLLDVYLAFIHTSTGNKIPCFRRLKPVNTRAPQVPQ